MVQKCTSNSKNLFLHPHPHCPCLRGQSALDLSPLWWLERNACLSRNFWVLAVWWLSRDDLCPPCPQSTTLVGKTDQQIHGSSYQKRQMPVPNVPWSLISILELGKCTGRAEKQTPEPFLKTPKGFHLFPKAFFKMSAEISPGLTGFCRMCNNRARCPPYDRNKEVDPQTLCLY